MKTLPRPCRLIRSRNGSGVARRDGTHQKAGSDEERQVRELQARARRAGSGLGLDAATNDPRDEGEHQSRHSEWVERSGVPVELLRRWVEQQMAGRKTPSR